MIKKFTIGLFFISFIMGCESINKEKMIIIEINNGWRVSALGKNEWLKAKVPGCIHTDLLSNKKIEDPFFRTNEKKLQWIDKVTWEYKTSFSISNDVLTRQNVRLNFKGLDTYADVYLNNKLVLKADNMFREWKVDCKKYLIVGKNTIIIIFHSPTQIGLEKLVKLGFQPPAANDLSEIGGMGKNKVSIFSRKAPYQFGWDWGPRLVTSGIWRPIYLEAWDSAKIENVFFQVKSVNKSLSVISASIEILSSSDQKLELTLTDVNNEKKLIKQEFSLKKGENISSFNFNIDNPKLWWTNGLGEPYLYKFTSALFQNNKVIDRQTTNFGIRTVKLIQKPDSAGKSFYVELNGVPVFMKGANYIPNDIFPTRVTARKYWRIISSAAKANINMLRVWGGGIYENDIFYDLCDQKGILAWQEFMFACSMYPVDSNSIQNIRQEFIDNVKRLRNHPCIALWCGNNEIDAGWAEGNEHGGWGWKQRCNAAQHQILWDSYKKIFYKTLPEVLGNLDSARFYWPSSPIAGFSDYGKSSLTSGDFHYWGVWHGKEPFEKFAERIGRFVSEYGFQSFPEFKTVKSYTIPEDYSIESEVMASHQRSGTGNMLIKKYMGNYYKSPKDFESFLYVSQVQQAEAIKSAIEAHRSRMPYCMGSLYWQLNDCWPVASWSSIDYFGRWKALHYFAKKAFNKFLISPRIEKDKIVIYAVSDSLDPFNAQLKLKLTDLKGKVLNSIQSTVAIKSNSSTKIYETETKSLLQDADPCNIFLFAELKINDRTLSDNIFYFVHPKDLVLPKPMIKTKVEKAGNCFHLILESNELAKNVYLSTIKGEGFFSDNYFDLIPGKKVIITFSPIRPIDNLNKILVIKTLTDTF